MNNTNLTENNLLDLYGFYADILDGIDDYDNFINNPELINDTIAEVLRRTFITAESQFVNGIFSRLKEDKRNFKDEVSNTIANSILAKTK